MAKVAFIGLGVMGYPMAGHLKTKGGHDVTVYNRTAAKGEAVYQRACARCHRSVERVVPLIAGPDAASTAAYLDRFLADHKAPDPAARADLIAYLLKLSGQ